jgi:hypothetical protein
LSPSPIDIIEHTIRKPIAMPPGPKRSVVK